MANNYQRRHYEEIARVLRLCRPDPELAWGATYRNWESICMNFEVLFLKDNPRFDTNKFYVACGFKEDQS